MEQLNNKVDGAGGAQGSLPAAEWNQVPSELQNIIQQLGQTLSSGDLNQVGKAIAGYVANGDFYTDSGAANAYVLTVIGTKQRAPAYTDGMQIRFIPDNTNGGASTVNVGALGVKSIKTADGLNLFAGDITAGEIVVAYFDVTADEFRLIPQLTTRNAVNFKSGRKNLIINGDFKQDCWQRGINFISAGSIYTADRWVAFAVGANTDIDRVGSTAFPTLGADIGFGLRIQPQVGSTDCPVETRLEAQDVFHLTNDTVTVQFIVNTNEAISLGIELRTPTVEDDWTASVIEDSTTKVLSSGDTLVTHTFVGLSSEVRKGLSLTLRPIGYTPGTLALSIANVQLEKGEQATDFEFRSIAAELEMCQRYFEPVSSGSSFVNGAAASSIAYRYNFRVEKRSVATLTETGIGGSVKGDRSLSPVANIGAIVNAGTHAAGEVTNWFIDFTADAEL